MGDTTIVMCWQESTEDIVDIWLRSIAKHTNLDKVKILLVTTSNMPLPSGLVDEFSQPILQVGLSRPEGKESSKLHGWMLDQVIPSEITTEYFLTMDSDCFPVADGWLDDLMVMMNKGAMLSGILHPWAPPPVDLESNKLEYRVRKQHCWETTHVACQMMRTSDYLYLHGRGCRFNGGDDTGLLIPKMTKEIGGKIDGFKPTRCPQVKDGVDFDPEFNRYSSLVFGDEVYHHGGFSRGRVLQDKSVFVDSFGWWEKKLLGEKSADSLLLDENSYLFKLDREEEVAKEKMQRLFGLKSQQLKG
jgi:hypothetical protein